MRLASISKFSLRIYRGLALSVVALLFVNISSSSVGASVESVTLVPSPNNVSSAEPTQIESISCISNLCNAVGYFGYNSSTFITNTGDGWELPFGMQYSGGVTMSISCPVTDLCYSVGIQESRPMILATESGHWRRVTNPNLFPSGSPDFLRAVSCVGRDFCMAVGHYMPRSLVFDNEQTRILKMEDGVWSLLPSPDADERVRELLTSVSCVSTTFCIATGHKGNLQAAPSMMIWDGIQWGHIGAEVFDSYQIQDDFSVSCASISFCFAVGSAMVSGNRTETLTFSWDGVSWQKVVSPNVVSNLNNTLRSVSCASVFFCAAVGHYEYESGVNRTLVLVWNGMRWQTLESPNAALDRNNILKSVSCVSTSRCVAVGYYGFANEITKSLVLNMSDQQVNSTTSVAQLPGSDSPETTTSAPSLSSPTSSASMISLTLAKGKAMGATRIANSARLAIPRGAKVTLNVSSKFKKICKVVGTSVKTLGKGTCPVKVVVTTKTQKKTSKTVTIRVN